MPLWIAWFEAVRALRPAAKRFRTFLWMMLVLVGLSCRPERAGVTSLVRLFGFGNRGYRRFLHLFHSRALDLDALTACWARLCLRLFQPVAVGGAAGLPGRWHQGAQVGPQDARRQAAASAVG